MQNKGAIRFFAIAFALACIFELSFTLVTNSVEKDAKEYAETKFAALSKAGNAATQSNPDSVKSAYERRYLDSMSTVEVYMGAYTYKECKENEINLGLDLRGGMNVTLEISQADIIRSLSNNNTDANFNKAIDNASLRQKNSQAEFINLFYEEYKKLDPNVHLATIFSTLELKDKIKYESSNDEVLNLIRTESKDAIDRSFNILRTRIDKFGVTQPNIQKLDVSGRILIELPGVKEPERVRKLLQGTANLEFWETFDNKDIQNKLVDANTKIAALLKGGLKEDKTEAVDTAAVKSDTTAATTAVTTDTAKADDGASLNASLNDKKKVESTDTSKSALAKKAKEENPLFEILQPAIYKQGNGYFAAEGPVVGSALIKDTGRVNSYLRLPQVKSVFPRNMKLLWTVKASDKDGKFLQLVAIKVSNRDGRAPLEGNVITDATGDFAQNSAKAEVSMTMNAEGAQIWKKLTGSNIGKSIAIVLDEYVYSYPTVNGEIAGGRSSITGNFDINEAKDLANILKAGKLPARARIVQEDVVGPTLGKEAISSGLLSFVIALLLVLVYMAIYYNKAGLVANVALIANVFFIMGILASLKAVLTLPGIAGIVLTIGLSVDANILIFERVREELRSGMGIKMAIREGFKHAMSSILDSNITTLILGIILYIFGNGPVQGFATTLIVGIITSLFAAIFVSRLVFEWMMKKDQAIPFSIPATENLYRNVNINFVGSRKKYYMFSAVIIVLGIVGLFKNGLNYGVDFKGGRTYIIRLDKAYTTDEIRNALSVPFGNAAPEVKTFGKDNQVKVTTPYLIDDNSAESDAKVETALLTGLNTISKVDKSNIMSSSKVGENISDDIKQSAVWAIIIACGLMFLFIFIRFQKWQFGLGAVVALVHDVLIVLSVFAIFNGLLPFSLEIDQNFIAAILTVMSYSMTDTVVVFDRIREFLRNNEGKELIGKDTPKIINEALNNTLSRTMNTSMTIFFVLLAIFIFGGEVIRGFSFALLIGIVIGTYSSICIATPIVIDLDKKTKE
jgi:SecD/SecF fusion protein